mmetsp:Transcript_13206/g.27433  ORF Transcript_13206/g.27433 Transcript_13206/m.27433 type:complete len:82 (-) Transcript_13206:674-919(-)
MFCSGQQQGTSLWVWKRGLGQQLALPACLLQVFRRVRSVCSNHSPKGGAKESRKLQQGRIRPCYRCKMSICMEPNACGRPL